MFDDELKAVDRATGVRGEARTVTLSRTYDSATEEVWDCLTNPERLPRWFLPVSGEFRLGGRYQIEGNAGGEILECEPPRRLRVTWIYGEGDGGISEVQVRLIDDQGGTRLELEHTATVDDERWAQFGPGAVGVGWDLTVLGLGMHLAGSERLDEDTWGQSPDGRAFLTASSEAWGAALAASGADPEAVATAVANTTAFYAPA
jgi:uncharacterized protein YndB with AHSA1/START domain